MTAFRFLSDYAAAPELDVYEKEHLDDRVFDENYLENLRNRQLADEEIEARLEAQRRAREKDDFAREGREGIDEDERQEAEEDSDEDYFDDEDDDDEVGEDGERERRLNLDAFDCPSSFSVTFLAGNSLCKCDKASSDNSCAVWVASAICVEALDS